MQFLCFLLLVAGLIICFGGIFFRKFCSAITGFLDGLILAVILIIAFTGSVFGTERDGMWFVILIIAGICAAISYAHEKLCAFINSFCPWFFIISIWLIMSVSNSDMELGAKVFVALIIAAIIGGINVSFYNYSYMLETAFVGALMASIGFAGMTNKATDMYDIFWMPFNNDDVVGGIIAGTLILGIIGFCVQLHRFRNKPVASKSSTTQIGNQSWKCSCGAINTSENVFCTNCGVQKGLSISSEVKNNFAQWVCTCGTRNENEMMYCTECGKHKPNNEIRKSAPEYWFCSCGNRNENGTVFCSECGAKKPDKSEPQKVSGYWDCSCGKRNKDDDAFCPECGAKKPTESVPAKVSDYWDCSCGKRNKDDDVFCSECGKKHDQKN